MKSEETWRYIHSERAQMADTLAALTPGQWAAASWCDGWSVQDPAGHILAAAEQTPVNFSKEMFAAGFKFNVFADRGARRLALIGPDQLVRRLRARTSTTNQPPEGAMVAVADSWKDSNLLIGAKRRIAGLRLRATDTEWIHGDGPDVAGPMISLILAMTGRKAAHPDLTAEGLATLGNRP